MGSPGAASYRRAAPRDQKNINSTNTSTSNNNDNSSDSNSDNGNNTNDNNDSSNNNNNNNSDNTNDNNNSELSAGCASRADIRPISVLRFWISVGLTQAES